MYVASTLVGVASYATATAARVVDYFPAITAPLCRLSARGLSSVSMVLEALNTLAVSQRRVADTEVAAIWALVMTAMAHIAVWDTNVACVMGHMHFDLLAALTAHFQACTAQCRRWFFTNEERALIEAEAHVATMLLALGRPYEPAASFSVCALHVLRTLLRFHRSECSGTQGLFFRAECRLGSDEYAAHTAFWLASHVHAKAGASAAGLNGAVNGAGLNGAGLNGLRALVDDLGMTDESFDRRVDAAHGALLSIRI